jgi:lysophospholipid acyltransferase
LSVAARDTKCCSSYTGVSGKLHDNLQSYPSLTFNSHVAFEALANSLGASPDERKLILFFIILYTVSTMSLIPPLSVKLVSSFLLSYPFAALLKRIPDSRPDAKNIFIIRYTTSDTYTNSSS